MKYLFIGLFLPLFTSAQFHVRVEPNPANGGQVNAAWQNNFVVTYTVNNWATKTVLNSQRTYQGRDDNGTLYYTSYFEPESFATDDEAVRFASRFKTRAALNNYLAYQLRTHKQLSAQWEARKKNLCFGCKENKQPVKARTIQVF